jgi:hypothetical protein
MESHKLKDSDALVGSENIWCNILVNAYDSYLKGKPDPVTPFETILEIQIDKLMGTLALIRAMMEDHNAKKHGENVVPFPRKAKT